MVLAVRDVRGLRPGHVQRDTASSGCSRTGTSEVGFPAGSKARSCELAVRCQTERRIIVKHLQFHTRKNDVTFAFLMAAVFAVTLAAAVAGTLDIAGGRASVEAAKTQTAHGDTGEPQSQIARAGARW
jgi:hypothetical protein